MLSEFVNNHWRFWYAIEVSCSYNKFAAFLGLTLTNSLAGDIAKNMKSSLKGQKAFIDRQQSIVWHFSDFILINTLRNLPLKPFMLTATERRSLVAVRQL